MSPFDTVQNFILFKLLSLDGNVCIEFVETITINNRVTVLQNEIWYFILYTIQNTI